MFLFIKDSKPPEADILDRMVLGRGGVEGCGDAAIPTPVPHPSKFLLPHKPEQLSCPC